MILNGSQKVGEAEVFETVREIKQSNRIKELEAQLEIEVGRAKRFIKAAVAIYESGSVTYMSDSEEDFQREVFGAMQEYLEKHGDKNETK